MKYAVSTLVLGSLLAARAAHAELADSLFSASVEYYPSSDHPALPGNTDITVLRTSIGAPLPISEETTLVLGAGYERIDVRSSRADSLVLHAPKLTAGVAQRFGERWTALALLDAGFASDFSESVGSEDVLLSLTGLLTYRLDTALELGAGATYDRRSGELRPLPALLVQWRVLPRFRVRGFAPVWLNAEYRAASWLDAGLRMAFDGNRFHVGEGVADEAHAEIAYANLTVGPRLTFSFSDWTHLDLYAAGAVHRRFEFFVDDASVARHSLSAAMGYGLRFWVAPSGW